MRPASSSNSSNTAAAAAEGYGHPSVREGATRPDVTRPATAATAALQPLPKNPALYGLQDLGEGCFRRKPLWACYDFKMQRQCHGFA